VALGFRTVFGNRFRSLRFEICSAQFAVPRSSLPLDRSQQAVARYGDNASLRLCLQKPFDLWKGVRKRTGHLLTSKIACGQNEGPNAVPQQSPFLSPMISEPVIFCQDDPLSLPDFSEPMLIGRIWREVVVVNFNLGTY